jgi:hypothetical protein
MIDYLGEPLLDFLKRSHCHGAWFKDMGGIGEELQPHAHSTTLFNLQTS